MAVSMKAWPRWVIGVAGAVVCVVALRGMEARPASRFIWPVPKIASRARPSVAVVLNYQKGRLKGMGTGVIIKSAGDIVTNYHVVAHATRVGVVLSNGRRFTAAVVGTDPPTDLAVVHIAHAGALQAIALAHSDRVVPGELVVAIGNSLGLTYSVTAGVISAADRTVERDGQVYHLIQTDAAINPGNSGGPLLNTNGMLIGINSSKISQTGVEGIGFAIPSDVVRQVVGEILRYGAVRRPWLGITVAAGPAGSLGLFVVAVSQKGPAAEAGVQAGDFLTTVNGTRLHTMAELSQSLAKSGIGGRLVMTVIRGSSQLTLTARVQMAPVTKPPRPAVTSPGRAAKTGVRGLLLRVQ